MSALEPCADCGADAAKPRVGSLGEHCGVWCTQCGAKANSVDAWNEGSKRRAWRGSSEYSFTHPVAARPCLVTDPHDRHYISVAGPRQLDRAGVSLGHPRQPGETDEQYRARLLS